MSPPLLDTAIITNLINIFKVYKKIFYFPSKYITFSLVIIKYIPKGKASNAKVAFPLSMIGSKIPISAITAPVSFCFM